MTKTKNNGSVSRMVVMKILEWQNKPPEDRLLSIDELEFLRRLVLFYRRHGFVSYRQLCHALDIIEGKRPRIV